MKNAWARLGFEYKKDGNDGKPLGMSEAVENWRDGMRQHASKAYDLSGVDIMYNTTVHRITLDGKKATGVELVGGDTIMARREVILAAGAYRTPQALLLSGIGPADELEKHHIPQLVDSSHFGRNLHDHWGLFQYWKLKHPEDSLAFGSAKWSNPTFAYGLPVDWFVYDHMDDKILIDALEKDGSLEEHWPLLNPPWSN